MDIQLYYAPNTCSLAPYITLTEAGADFRAMPLNFRAGQNKTSEYMALNPKHKVPLLVVDGRTMTESTAIQIWIARTFPEAKLLPADPWEELQAIGMHSWCSSGIHPYLSRINSPGKVCDVPGAEEDVHNKALAFVEEAFALADETLSGRDYFFGNFTAPDAHFYWCFRRATQFGLDLSAFKNCGAHFARMEQRESVKTFLAFEEEVKKNFAAAA